MFNDKRIFYQITIQGRLDSDWSDWLNGFEVHTETDEKGACITILDGSIKDQAALRGVLNKIWDLNLELVAINRRQL
ncbi:MAG: hypothetical protein JXA42_05200 [Anaerolineales bacterium]|nr:hypothetical protein [Anaerolineales bacterium]